MELNAFGDVRKCVVELQAYLKQTGTIDDYLKQCKKRNNNASKRAIKMEKDRKRIAEGSDYESSD